MANPILENTVAISPYGTPQIITWRLRDSLEYSDNYGPQTTSESALLTSLSVVQSEQPRECVYEGGD